MWNTLICHRAEISLVVFASLCAVTVYSVISYVKYILWRKSLIFSRVKSPKVVEVVAAFSLQVMFKKSI